MNNGVPWSTPRMNPTHLNFDNDAFLEGIQFYADLANKHKVAPTASETQSMSTMDLFVSGRAAMALADIGDIKRSTGPTAWISISLCCRPDRGAAAPARTSGQRGLRSPQAVPASSRRGSS